MAPMTVLYVLLLWSSMEGLPTVSVATVVIGRSLIPFLRHVTLRQHSSRPVLTSDYSCIIERIAFGTTFRKSSYLALALIVVGSTVYTLQTNEFKTYGIRFVVLNVLLSVITPLFERQIVRPLILRSHSTYACLRLR